ncbi:hypothetical protein [Streptomyces hypolithicus]
MAIPVLAPAPHSGTTTVWSAGGGVARSAAQQRAGVDRDHDRVREAAAEVLAQFVS